MRSRAVFILSTRFQRIVDQYQINETYSTQEAKSTPPWRHSIRKSSVNLAVGELLQLNIDAFDINDDDDVNIVFASDADIPPNASLGPRQCCSDDFSVCNLAPLDARQMVEVNSTFCDNEANDDIGSTVRSSCRTICTRQAVRKSCRAGLDSDFYHFCLFLSGT